MHSIKYFRRHFSALVYFKITTLSKLTNELLQTTLKSAEEEWWCENKKCSVCLVGTGAKRKAIENNCEAPEKIIKHILDENSLDGNNSTIQEKDNIIKNT
ncbi:FLYWCH-type domain-containing protein [Aphis craccivora]|uniref:FLYWCH-type domain-containing protein n=1 Tax=Aphis craccivora TaxID=307492 RepID=A0A6G0YKA0_APHCR|nr:FLYWCH-type domain-containing protein [Aphis craccivora]